MGTPWPRRPTRRLTGPARLAVVALEVIALAARLMIAAAAFQLFDGLQRVSTGTMRGAGDTRTPVVCILGAYWGVGLPLGCLLTFNGGYGVIGLWIGLVVSGVTILLA